MNKLTVFILVLLIIPCVFSIWNLFSVFNIKKGIRENKDNNDSRFYELKYKIEFIIACFSVIIVVVGILGYNTIENAKKELNEYFIAKNDSLRKSFERTEIKINSKNFEIDFWEKKISSIEENTRNSSTKAGIVSDRLSKLKQLVDTINSKNIIKQNYYVVKSLKCIFSGSQWGKTYYFKDLITDIGDRLPKFNTTPLVIPVSEGNWHVEVFARNNEYFKVTAAIGDMDANDKDTVSNFSVLIIEKK